MRCRPLRRAPFGTRLFIHVCVTGRQLLAIPRQQRQHYSPFTVAGEKCRRYVTVRAATARVHKVESGGDPEKVLQWEGVFCSTIYTRKPRVKCSSTTRQTSVIAVPGSEMPISDRNRKFPIASGPGGYTWRYLVVALHSARNSRMSSGSVVQGSVDSNV